MKNGLWISVLVLALLGRGANLIAEDAPWQAVSRPLDEPAATVTLGQPLPLQAAPANPSSVPALFVPPPDPSTPSKPALLPDGIVPVGYEVPQSPPETPPQPPSPPPSIIAVSASRSAAKPDAAPGVRE